MSDAPLVPVAGPWITDLERSYVADAVSTNWYGNARDYVHRFERAFAAHTTRRHAVSLPSCTAGIHLALAAADIGPGDEVIVPESTWIATAAPVTYVGAEPVFVDVDPVTWCIDPASLATSITSRTRAVIPVDLYGVMADHAAIAEVLDGRDILVLEDAAEAVGSRLDGRAAGAFGDAAVFSFHGSKTMTTGEGGMLVTDDDELHARILVLRDHGRRPGTTDFRSERVGFKYQLSSMQAALGLAQLERIEELVERKREIFAWYAERLAGLPLRLNAEPSGSRSSYWMVTAVFDAELGLDKQVLRDALRHDGIDSRPFFDPLTSTDPFRDARGGPERNPVSYDLAWRSINLPSALSLTASDVDRVAASLVRLVDSVS